MATKRVIILERLEGNRFRYVMWADVLEPRQPFYANAAAVSAWKGASPEEVAALRAGQVVEREDVASMDSPTDAKVQDELQTTLEEAWQAFQAEISSSKSDRWVRYGSWWDGAQWSAGV